MCKIKVGSQNHPCKVKMKKKRNKTDFIYHILSFYVMIYVILCLQTCKQF